MWSPPTTTGWHSNDSFTSTSSSRKSDWWSASKGKSSCIEEIPIWRKPCAISNQQFLCVLSVSIYTQSSSLGKMVHVIHGDLHLGNASHHPLRDLSCAFSSWQRSLPQGVQKGLPNTKMSLPFLGTKVIKNEWLPVLLCTWLLRCSIIILDPLSGGKNASLHHHLRPSPPGIEVSFWETPARPKQIVTCPARLV